MDKLEIRLLEDIAPHILGLSALLLETVECGASIGFLPPVSNQEVEAFWRETEGAVREKRILVLAAFADSELVGTVLLSIPGKANATHRIELQKLMVSPAHRRKGIGESLMLAAEETARKHGRSLLALDTRKGDPASLLYLKLGYSLVGEIPGYARSASGKLHTTLFFYKTLG